MADDLDDFFAKKDKKKKTKSKFTPAELLQQQQTSTTGDGNAAAEKKKKKKSKSKEASETSASVDNKETFSIEKEEDWVAYEVEKEVDYSGLRIANLQISKENEEENEEEEEYEEDEEGNTIERKVKEESGPWNKAVQPVPQTVQRPATPESEEEKPPVVEEEEAPAAAGAPKKYVPPSVRRAAALAAVTPASGPPLRLMRGRKKEAPDVQNVMEFPSLGGMTPAQERQQEREFGSGSKFETVRVGNRDLNQSSATQKLELGNRFASLEN